ncbi:YdcH family protein [Vibrio scophthalmi]|uniref:YdcH family protein n=1 Tax=Vibrio scophthalmi TaxID=45658 RepID=UPI002FF0ED79
MLGEDHSLLKEFPEHKDDILSLAETDLNFNDQMKEYNAIDKQIRTLELRDSPISDEEMHTLKLRRAQMKDDLFQQLHK